MISLVSNPRPSNVAAPKRVKKRRWADQMKLVLDISRLLTVTDMSMLLDRISTAASSLLEAEKARLFIYDAARGLVYTDPLSKEEDVRSPDEAGLIGQVFRSGEVVVRENPQASANREYQMSRKCLWAPLKDLDHQTLGVLEVQNKLQGTFTPDDKISAELLAEQAAIAIQRYRLQSAAIQAVELTREMELARRVQAALLPTQPPRIAGISATGWMSAASLTGGDCFDLWLLPDGRLAIFLGDASGHGLAAALVIAQVRTLLRALSEIRPDPDWLLARVNSRLAEDLDEGRFVTAFFGVLSSAGELQWSSAGQGPLFVRRASGLSFEPLQAPAVPLGVSPDLMTEPTTPIQLGVGGTLAVLSDGVFEASNDQREMFGPVRVSQLLEECGEVPPSDVVDRVRSAVIAWQGTEEPVDDQTIVVVQRANTLHS